MSITATNENFNPPSFPLTLLLSLFFAQHGPKLSLYLYEMLHDHKDSLTKDEQNAVGVFMTSLKLCGHRCIPPNAPHKQDLLRAIKEVSPYKGCRLLKGKENSF